MARKAWTPKTEITDSLLKFREKRRWQLGFRRYVLERTSNESYAPYFGLDVETLRGWFELQFTDTINWTNFGKAWQFDHIVPANYFDFSDENDLKLCWNFVNMRVEITELNGNRGNSIDVLAVKSYFQDLYNRTGFSICRRMLEKIEKIEVSNIESNTAIEAYIIKNRAHLESIASLSNEEFNLLNQGLSVEKILLQREILRKFG